MGAAEGGDEGDSKGTVAPLDPALFSLLPPLCKGRWIAEGKTEGLFCLRGTDRYNPPASLRSAPSLTQGGQGI